MTAPHDAASARLAGITWAFQQHPDVTWVVDRDGIIRGVGRDAWEREARDGAAPVLADPRSVVDHALFEFIEGEDVRESYRKLMDVAAQGRRAVAFPLRCDAPDRERYTRMTITALREGGHLLGYLFQSATLHEVPRVPVALRPAMTSEDAPSVALCSYCNRVRESPGGLWMRVDDYYAGHGPGPVRLTHTVCGGCSDGVLRPLISADASA